MRLIVVFAQGLCIWAQSWERAATLRRMFGLRPNKAQSVIAAVLLGLGFTSCSLGIDPLTRQCTRDGDCASFGVPSFECIESLCVEREPEKEEEAEPDPRFSCAEDRWAQEDDSQTIKYDLVVSNLLGSHPYKGMTVYVCPSFDPDCKKPDAKTVSDDKGRISLELPLGFRGHLALPTPEGDPTIVPVDAHVFPPPSKNKSAVRRKEVVVVSRPVLEQLADLDGAKVVPGNGHLSFTTLACDGELLASVKVEVSKKNKDTWSIYAGASGLPDPQLHATGPAGRGAILNIPPGYRVVTATHPDFGKIFEQSVVIKKDTVTSVPIVPSLVP